MAHVLLVEDERLVALVFRAALADEGHRVTAVGDGVSAVAAYLLDPAEVLVTDLRLPRMGGRELVGYLRGRTPGLPVVVVSWHAGDARELDGGGATVLLGKPVSPSTLVEEVAALVGRGSLTAGAVAAGPAAVASLGTCSRSAVSG